MKPYTCLFDNSAKKYFLKFPATLYGKNSPQNYKTEKAILDGKHILSCDMEVWPIVVIDDIFNNTICRCLLTFYPDDPVAYVGFFEAHNDITAVEELMKTVEELARKNDKTTLLGPIDASIYINYRFKTKKFDKTYTAEPYNLPYYADLWRKCGFVDNVKYVSNQLRRVEEFDLDPRLERIYERYISKGYEVKHPTNDTFEQCLVDIYHVMMDSYSCFLGFKHISKQQFLELYRPLKQVLNFDMVDLMYKDDTLHAFSVAIPNYGNLTRGNLTLSKILKIKKLKKNPQEYVLLYVGADKTPGIGSALLHHVRNNLYQNQCSSITALIKDGNLTGKVYTDVYIDQFEYVLLEKKL